MKWGPAIGMWGDFTDLLVDCLTRGSALEAARCSVIPHKVDMEYLFGPKTQTTKLYKLEGGGV